MDHSSVVFELRTYTPHPGKLEALEARFRDHTIGLFQRHGLEVVGFWRSDAPKGEQKFIYLLRFPSREAANSSWDAFRDDPEWIEVRAVTEANGPLNASIESVYMEATEYSPLS